jgi:hypothetical protein
VVQLFDTVVHLDADGFPSTQGDGIVSSAVKNGPAAYERRAGATGFAWAARRDVLEEVGFLDGMVLGGADTYMACGFAGVRPPSVFAQLPADLGRAVDLWCERARAATDGHVGNLCGTVEHMSHGRLQDRRYLHRYQLLRRAAFNPTTDLVLEQSGLYAWKNPSGQLQTEVATYFSQRSLAENR